LKSPGVEWKEIFLGNEGTHSYFPTRSPEGNVAVAKSPAMSSEPCTTTDFPAQPPSPPPSTRAGASFFLSFSGDPPQPVGPVNFKLTKTQLFQTNHLGDLSRPPRRGRSLGCRALLMFCGDFFKEAPYGIQPALISGFCGNPATRGQRPPSAPFCIPGPPTTPFSEGSAPGPRRGFPQKKNPVIDYALFFGQITRAPRGIFPQQKVKPRVQSPPETGRNPSQPFGSRPEKYLPRSKGRGKTPKMCCTSPSSPPVRPSLEKTWPEKATNAAESPPRSVGTPSYVVFCSQLFSRPRFNHPTLRWYKSGRKSFWSSTL